jgi:hypothetical protein
LACGPLPRTIQVCQLNQPSPTIEPKIFTDPYTTFVKKSSMARG